MASASDKERLRDALFHAGPQWGQKSPDDIIAAIEAAGFTVCEPLKKIDCAPRTGKVFLALDSLGYPHIVWGDDRGFFDEQDGDERKELEWWSPIPPIPTS